MTVSLQVKPIPMNKYTKHAFTSYKKSIICVGEIQRVRERSVLEMPGIFHVVFCRSAHIKVLKASV